MLRLVGIAAVGAAMLAPSLASATVVRSLTLYEKSQIAPVVVLAQVERVEPQWELEGASVRTMVTVRVLEALKGGFTAGERLTLRQGGGKIGAFDHRIQGMSPYEPGEQAILFLEPLGTSFVEIGIGIGKYNVEGDGPSRFVTHDPKVALASKPAPGMPMRIEPPAPMEPEPLHDFLKRVRSYVRGIQVPARSLPANPEPRPALPAPREPADRARTR